MSWKSLECALHKSTHTLPLNSIARKFPLKFPLFSNIELSQTRMSGTRRVSRILPMFGYLFARNRDHSHADCSGEHIAASTMMSTEFDTNAPASAHICAHHTMSAVNLHSVLCFLITCAAVLDERVRTLVSFALSISISIQYHTGNEFVSLIQWKRCIPMKWKRCTCIFCCRCCCRCSFFFILKIFQEHLIATNLIFPLLRAKLKIIAASIKFWIWIWFPL